METIQRNASPRHGLGGRTEQRILLLWNTFYSRRRWLFSTMVLTRSTPLPSPERPPTSSAAAEHIHAHGLHLKELRSQLITMACGPFIITHLTAWAPEHERSSASRARQSLGFVALYRLLMVLNRLTMMNVAKIILLLNWNEFLSAKKQGTTIEMYITHLAAS